MATDDSAIQISNLDVAGSWCGLGVWNVDGLVFTGPVGSGWGTVWGDAIQLHNVRNSTISDLDVSWTGDGTAGTGIWTGDGSLNNRIENVEVAKQSNAVALDIDGDRLVKILGVRLLREVPPVLYLGNIDGFET